MLSVCVRLDIKQDGTNRNHCKQQLENLARTYLLMNPDRT